MSYDLHQQDSSSTPEFQSNFNEALDEYKKKTGKDLITHPLTAEIKHCESPEAILAVLEGKANDLNQSQSSDERLTKWLAPTVNALNSLAPTLGQGFGMVCLACRCITTVLTLTLRYFPLLKSSFLESVSSLW